MRCTRVGLALGSTLLLATACGGSSGGAKDSGPTGGSTPGATVHLAFTEFKPVDYAIKVGQALTFENDNPITHVIVEGPWKAGPDGLRTSETDDGAFHLKINPTKGFTAEHVFDKAGTFPFFCTIHKGMNATVTVS